MSEETNSPGPQTDEVAEATTAPLPVVETAATGSPAATGVPPVEAAPADAATAAATVPTKSTWAVAVAASVVLALALSAVSFGAGVLVGRQGTVPGAQPDRTTGVPQVNGQYMMPGQGLPGDSAQGWGGRVGRMRGQGFPGSQTATQTAPQQ